MQWWDSLWADVICDGAVRRQKRRQTGYEVVILLERVGEGLLLGFQRDAMDRFRPVGA